ncbi:Type VI secretion system protein [Bosea sp. 62]|uniref:type VI secretion system baseplate subunit TssE n=1 Tax=unclassified Bosea (in: a-proteobacteria) TaxID=2653178 RepID=UPI001251F16C|nr:MULTISPECIES: type VI secretion system baseplate subunit TssE [unclassified Bosea (in: a-proteobacteria)]CAD5293924.1 Type VI secretion system protein [Bosea sp. 21B]CAD5294520.1 Type VI secretion system protein [Bosea sp. 46]CAD5298987.1 Type VI secretion system protein [Bosea sp. 7B]VVT60821.1 Type VI secretion system protein [Bosea sp. EC-HK365B]VXB40162.1 Type VI secretion system protein [Bosea sp. 127]
MASLFERLETAREPGVGSPDAAPQLGLSDSVLANVRRILNARQGCCETRPDFGMPDLNDISREASETIPAIAQTVKAQLETFEPRLREVLVKPMLNEAPGEFAFSVSAVLIDGENGEAMRFDTVLGNDRQMRLRN